MTDGNTFITQTDVDIPGLGGGLKLVRTWNSLWPSGQEGSEIGIFGQHWTSNLEERTFVGNDGYVKYLRSDGSFWSFGGISGQSSILGAAAPANATETLATGTSNWTLVAKNGDTKVFDVNTGKLLSIIDRNGNTTTLTYDSALRLVTVTDPASRHLYFTYGQDSASNLVTGVTSDFGIAVSYVYDAYQRLTQVTKPDGTHINFEYGQSSINDPSSPLITAVKDNDGKVLEAHSYDADGKGLSGTAALGVNGVSITWPDHVFGFSIAP